jgi:outer membrane protein TolC
MKKFVFTFLILTGFALIAPCGYSEENKSDTPFDLSLPEAITFAFKNNKDIQIQEEEIVIARANIEGARSQFLPKLNLNAGYTRNGAVTSITLPGSKKDAGIFGGYKNDNKLSLSFDETIFNGGANVANLKQAQLGLKVQEETLRSRKLDVEFETKRLYYGLLLAYETERIAQDLMNQAQSHYEDAKNKFSQGTASRFDMLQSKVQVSKVTPELIKAKNAVDLIAAQLKKLLGIKIQGSIRLKDRLEYSLLAINEGEFLKQAYLNKPEMILMSLGVDISKWSIQTAKSSWRPQVNAAADYSYRSDNTANMFNNRHNNWNAGFSVTIPIFDGFASKAKVDEAQARYAQANLEKEDLSEQIAVDIRQACLDLIQAKAIIDSSQDNIEEAKEALKISEVSFDNGEGTNLEILDAQMSLSQIQENYSEGIYDYLMARAFLERTMGQGYLQEAKNEKKD